MRPRTIDQVIGQQHLVGEGKIIRRMVEANRLSSMILYGPPGIGRDQYCFCDRRERLSMPFGLLMQRLTVKTPTRNRRGSQVFRWLGHCFGWIHRLDKTKQDFLLPLLESGLVIMIGATTEIPFSLSHPIRSRVQIMSWNRWRRRVKASSKTALDDPRPWLWFSSRARWGRFGFHRYLNQWRSSLCL